MPHSRDAGSGSVCYRARIGVDGGCGWVAGTPAGDTGAPRARATSVQSSFANCTALDCCRSNCGRKNLLTLRTHEAIK